MGAISARLAGRWGRVGEVGAGGEPSSMSVGSSRAQDPQVNQHARLADWLRSGHGNDETLPSPRERVPPFEDPPAWR